MANPNPGSKIISFTFAAFNCAIFCEKYSFTSSVMSLYSGFFCIVCGVPFMCIKMYGTFNSLMASNIFSSNSHPETSLIIEAPAFTATRATFPRNVSIETMSSGYSSIIFSIIGAVLSISSCSEKFSAPDFVEYPPMSIISAPSDKCFSTFSKIKSIE